MKSNNVLGMSFESILEDKNENEIFDILEGESNETEKSLYKENFDNTAVKKIVIDDIEILLSFIKESQEHLENIEEKILKLESSNDETALNEIFRSMHTIKGNSSFFGFDPIKKLSHSLETLLDNLRNKTIQINPDITDILLEGTDILNGMISEINNTVLSLSNSEATIEIQDISYNIDFLISKIEKLKTLDTPKLKEKEKQTIANNNANNDLVTNEILEQFVAESNELLDIVEKDFLELEKDPSDLSRLDDAFRHIHTIKGNAGFLGQKELEKACIDLENTFDSIKKQKREVNVNVITLILNTVDSIRRVLDFIKNEEISTEQSNEYKPLGEILIEKGEATEDDVEEALNLQNKKVGEILIAQGKVSKECINNALQVQAKMRDKIGDINKQLSFERKDIRVDMWKLDKLFNLVGEIITAEAMIIHNPEIEQLKIDHREKFESFNRSAGYLGKITREIQEIAMSMRMIPLDGIFNKMKRLVRDLSRKFNKEINFTISGQETEMDRNVIEKISDPLIHIIRNALDHGIEDTETRLKRNKTKIGNLHLGAKYEGNEIWITVKDDGAGLDREKIISKAKERGLLQSSEEKLSDEEVWQLIFEPGFSTAEKVSEISGRGVGMDVVRRNIEELKGKIEIKSSFGEGTEIILKIPLTLAIFDGIILKTGNTIFALTLDDILEFHKASKEQITKTDSNREVFKLRDKIIPIIKLREFFKLNNGKINTSEGLLIIVKANNRIAALLVDEIIGYQQIVIKALPRYVSNIKAISGCSLLGNGEVSLIIDTGALLKYELN